MVPEALAAMQQQGVGKRVTLGAVAVQVEATAGKLGVGAAGVGQGAARQLAAGAVVRITVRWHIVRARSQASRARRAAAWMWVRTSPRFLAVATATSATTAAT